MLEAVFKLESLSRHRNGFVLRHRKFISNFKKSILFFSYSITNGKFSITKISSFRVSTQFLESFFVVVKNDSFFDSRAQVFAHRFGIEILQGDFAV